MLRTILDLGCGKGKWAKRLGAPPNNSLVIGIDISPQACVAASHKGPNPSWLCACARGEQIPLQDGSVDAVISTVAIPYMNIPAALGEIRRVLRPGGSLDVTLHPFSFVLREFRDRPPLTPRSFLYRFYVVANGPWFHLTGRVLPYPFGRRCESWQSKRGLRIALEQAGFTNVQCTFLSNGSFVVRALSPFPVQEANAVHATAA